MTELRLQGMIASVVPSRGSKRPLHDKTCLVQEDLAIFFSRVLLEEIEAEITGSRTDKSTIEIRPGMVQVE